MKDILIIFLSLIILWQFAIIRSIMRDVNRSIEICNAYQAILDSVWKSLSRRAKDKDPADSWKDEQ